MSSINPTPVLLSEYIGTPLPLPRPTAYDLIASSSTAYPTRTALVCMHQPSSFLSSILPPIKSYSNTPPPYLSWTYEQLKHASHVLACSLAAAGIKPGMVISTFIHNCAELHLFFWASLELNCIFAPIQARVAASKEEAEHILDMISPSVLLVQEADIAEKLMAASPEIIAKVAVKIFSPVSDPSSPAPTGWTNLASFIENGLSKTANEALIGLDVKRRDEDVILVMTTSGTTSLPKGCPHTSRSFSAGIRGWQAKTNFVPDDCSLLHVPLSHVMGIVFAFTFHASGLKCVHPSSNFTPESSLAAIKIEKPSYVPGVPAMIHALLAHPKFDKKDMECVKCTLLSATTILPETLRMAMDDFGSENALSGFGMTEAGPVALPDNPYVLSNMPITITCGTGLDGVKLRICKPGSLELVERGVPGECHIGGDAIIQEYWLGKTHDKTTLNDAFYTDSEGMWIKTGDRAVMHPNGELGIVGRYKDMIIRGGENISPLAIESILFSRLGIQAEVIGVPDDIAGEIPLAIVKRRPGQEFDLLKVREELVKELGAAWVPEELIDIESLGVDNYPYTSSGKVRKNALRKIVMESREAAKATANGDKSRDLLNNLIQLWTDLLKVAPGTLTPATSVYDWADSLILSRFSGVLHRQTGLLLNIQELTENPTIQAQATLLSTRSSSSSSTEQFLDIAPAHDGPPTIEDMVHTFGDEERFIQTKEMAEATLAPLGLNWEDVEDVIPMNSMQDFFIKYRRPQTSNHRHAFLALGSTVSSLQVALESALAHHSMLRTMGMYFDSTTPLHITVRPSQRWFSHCITVLPPVKSRSDLSTLVYNDPNLDHACFPGPLFRMILTHVEDSNCAGLVYQVQHSTFDAISLTMFLDDLDILLQNPSATIKPHIPFKSWADNYYTMQDSPAARSSVKWQANRLKGIASFPDVLAPVQRAPEWFKGSSHGWIDLNTGKPGPERKALDAEPIGVTGIKGRCSLPDIQALKVTHGVEGSQIVKAALAVLTTGYTNQTFALFGQSQAGRTWPFLPSWQVSRMPPPMNINGPCVQSCLNRIAVDKEERVMDMLARLQAEQQLLNKHAYAPSRQVAEALDAFGGGDGQFSLEAFKRQIFNWLPIPPEFEHKRLEMEQVESRTDCGLLWNCTMIDRTTLQIHPTWDDAQLSKKEVQEMLDDLLRISELFATESNWDKTIRTVL